MMFPNKKNSSSIADRLYRLYSRRMQTEISAALSYPAPNSIDRSPLVAPAPDDDVTRERDPACWRELPALLEMHRRQARANRENPSDSLPWVMPVFCFENGIETAMLGGKARWLGTRLHTYGEPVEPLIRDYREFDWALPDEDNEWFQRYLDAYRYFVTHAAGDFAIAFQAGVIAMNFAVQLRGTERAYLDIYDDPDNLRRLLQYSLLLNTYLYGRVEELAGPYNRELYGNHPLAKYREEAQPAASVDAYSLCAPGTLREWGMQEIATFNMLVGGTFLHIHENSRQVIEEVIEIPGWRLGAFTDGQGYPRSFDIRWALRQRMRDIPLQICCAKEEFLQALEKKNLPGNIRYCFGVDSLSEAERIMDKVHAYEAPEGV